MKDKNDTKMVWGDKRYFALLLSINPLTFHHPLFSLPLSLVSLFISYIDDKKRNMMKEIKAETDPQMHR